MITLITGLPGNGKSLYALNWVKAKAEAENRTVYYNGIADLTLPWVHMDEPEQWHTLPTGALIVIDESQRVFRPRASGANVPAHVSAFETHRHNGHDVVLITQHPQLLDQNIRRLVGQHFHAVRKFGMARATVYEWGQVQTLNKSDYARAIRHEFAFPAEAFGWYKSAELHTHKRKLPMRFWFVLAAPLVIGGVLWAAYVAMQRLQGHAPAPSTPASSILPLPPAASGHAPATMTAAEYAESMQPRVSGLAYTAPAYDGVTKPTRAPVPVAVVKMGNRCQAYSQQGTRLNMPQALCASLLETGFFVAWDESPPARPAAAANPPDPARSSEDRLRPSPGPA